MRIAFISYEYPPDTGKGGIGTYVSQIAKAMAAFHWDVHVFAAGDQRSGTELTDGWHVHRVECTSADDFKTKVVKEFSMQHRALAFDIMESPEINGNAREIKKKYPDLPLIVRLHAPGFLVESLKKKYIPFFAKLRFVLGSLLRLRFDLGYWRPYDKSADADYQFIQLADYITAPSAAMKGWVIDNWQIPADKITVIPNIFLPPQALLAIPVAEVLKYRCIILFGRLNALKGLVNATRAMKKILKEYPGWQFKVIGDDGPGPRHNISMRKWMRGQLKEVISRVEFTGGVAYEDLPAAIAHGEIVLLPSLFESFSYTCAEAMAAGKAVVGSKNAGMADLLQNNKGILIDPYDYREIVSSLKKLIDDNSFRYQLSMNAREGILHDFNATEAAKKFQAFYENLAAGHLAKN